MTTKLNPKKIIGDFITLEQVMQSLQLSDRTVRNYIKARKLRAYKLDGKLVFNVLDVEAFLQRRRVGGGTIAPVIKDVSQDQVRMLNDEEIPALPYYLKPGWKPPSIAGLDLPVPKSTLISGDEAINEALAIIRRKR